MPLKDQSHKRLPVVEKRPRYHTIVILEGYHCKELARVPNDRKLEPDKITFHAICSMCKEYGLYVPSIRDCYIENHEDFALIKFFKNKTSIYRVEFLEYIQRE